MNEIELQKRAEELAIKAKNAIQAHTDEISTRHWRLTPTEVQAAAQKTYDAKIKAINEAAEAKRKADDAKQIKKRD